MGRRPLAGWRAGVTATQRGIAATAGPRYRGMTAGRAPHIVVVGGGLAGVAAAIALCDAGARVTLAEARPRLGGATCSFTRGSLTVDNGQHIFLRCCTAYRGLLDRLGMTSNTVLQEKFDVRVLTPAGAARLRRRGLPAPFHLASALATYPLLSPRERAGAVRAALAFLRLDPADPGTDDRRLGDWLAAHGQGPRARRGLWDLFVVSALNIAGDDASLALAAMVIKTALLGGPGAADIGVPTVPLGDLHGRAAGALLRRLGATVLTGAKVTAISLAANEPGPAVTQARDSDIADGPGSGDVRGAGGAGGAGRVRGRDQSGGFMVRLGGPAAYPDAGAEGAAGWGLDYLDGFPADGTGGDDPAGSSRDTVYRDTVYTDTVYTDTVYSDTVYRDTATTHGSGSERFLAADGVVLAVPPQQAANLLPASAAGPPGSAADPASWRGLGESPIVNVHVVYDRPVTGLRFAAAVDSPVQWIFDRTKVSGCEQGQYLAISLSAADEYAGQRSQRLRATFLPAIEQILPAARTARVSDFFVTRERRATFRQIPGTAALRPGAATPLSGLVLAGAWTDTGWPDTMEGAVRSGLEAARNTLASLGVRR